MSEQGLATILRSPWELVSGVVEWVRGTRSKGESRPSEKYETN